MPAPLRNLPRVIYLGDLPEVVSAIRTTATVELAGCFVEDGEALTRISAMDPSIPVSLVPDLASLRDQLLRQTDIDFGVISNFGLILPPDCLAMARHGFVNAHFGLLPENPGRHPIRRAIENCAERMGVTLHRVTSVPDAGEVLERVVFPAIRDSAAAFERHERAAAALVGRYLRGESGAVRTA